MKYLSVDFPKEISKLVDEYFENINNENKESLLPKLESEIRIALDDCVIDSNLINKKIDDNTIVITLIHNLGICDTSISINRNDMNVCHFMLLNYCDYKINNNKYKIL